jgi:hypothetical protein
MSDSTSAPGDSRLPWTQGRTVWAATTVASLWYASRYGCPLPFADEMDLLPQACHCQPVTLAWLWAPHNEHRIFLPKLIYLGLGWASGYDFRAGSFWNVAMLAALSAVWMLTARAVRGRSSLYDAFLPLAVQHWGQPLNILWGFQIVFTTATFLAGLALAAVARCRGSLSPAAAAGITLSLLGKAAGRAQRVRRVLALTALAAILLALVAAYFTWPTRLPHHGSSPGTWAVFVTATEFLATSLGIGVAANLWPASGILVLAGCAASFAQLCWIALRRPEERVRALGLLAFLGAMLLMALGVGWGRAGFGADAGMQDRYVTLAMPLLCLFYLQGVIYARPLVWRHVERALLLLACVAIVVNCRKGWNQGRTFRELFARLESDMRAGIPPEALAVRHGDRLGFGPIPAYAAQLAMLRQARRGPYRDDAAYRIDPSIRVWRLVEVTQLSRPLRFLPLARGREFQQPFSLPGGVALTRIDMQIDSLRRRRLCRRLDWTLYQRASGGPLTVVARGQVAPAHDIVGEYVSLAPDRIAFSGPADLILGLSMPAGTPEDEGARLPLFDGPTPGRLAGSGPADPVVGSLHAFAVGFAGSRTL